MKQLFSIYEAAEYAEMSVSAIRKLVVKEVSRRGHRIFISRAILDDAINDQLGRQLALERKTQRRKS